MALRTANKTDVLRYLVSLGVLTQTGPDDYVGDDAISHDGSKLFRMVARVTREADGKAIKSVAWKVQSVDTGAPPNNPKRGRLASAAKRR